VDIKGRASSAATYFGLCSCKACFAIIFIISCAFILLVIVNFSRITSEISDFYQTRRFLAGLVKIRCIDLL